MSLRESLKVGIGTGFLGSLCCTTPIIIVALGIGSIGFALGFTKYRPFFIILGLIFLSFALYRKIKQKEGNCNVRSIKANLSIIVFSVIISVIIWILLIYVIAPFLGRIVYG
jgi:hypothetical protein